MWGGANASELSRLQPDSLRTADALDADSWRVEYERSTTRETLKSES